MTVYTDYLVLDNASVVNPPASITRNITSADTIVVTIDTTTGAAGASWSRYSTPVGCTVSPTLGNDGTTSTITPTAGATSYSVIFRTFDAEFTTYYYGKVAGTIGTVVSDTTPNAFTFTDQTGVALSSTITSNTITVSGIDAATAISIAGGTYSINGGAYTSSSGTVTNGQTVTVQHTSSAVNSGVIDTTLTIGGVFDTFTSTTLAVVATPTYSVANTSTNEGASATANVTTTNVANATTLYWTVNATTADVSTISGSFTINTNAGSFTIPAIADSLTEGAEAYTISVRTGSTAGTVVATSTLTINDTSTTPVGPTYSVANASTNEGASATVNVSTANVANATTLYWTVNATTADVSTISGSFTINTNAGSFTIPAIADSLTEGIETYTISVRTGSTAGTVVATSTLTINDTSVSTVYDTTPDAFSFVDRTGAQTNTVYTDNVIITGLEPNYTLTVTATNGTVDATTALPFSGIYATSKTVTTSSTGSIIISAKATSSPTAGSQVDCIITVGTVSDTFSITTYAPGTQVNQFTFTDVTEAAFSTVYTSNAITVSGLNAGLSATVTVSNGTYSKNGGAYTAVNGSVVNGDTITVRVTSSSGYSTIVSATLTIFAYTSSPSVIYASVYDSFTVTTPKFVYSLTPTFVSLYESRSMPMVLETSGIANGTVLYWTLDSATTADFSAVNGSFTISSNTGTFNITTLSDVVTEGTETYTLSIRSGSTSGTVLTTSTVIVKDPPINAHGMQIMDSSGNIVLDTSTFTVKDAKYAVSITDPITLSVPTITNDTIVQVTDLATTGVDPPTANSVILDYINKLLIVTGGSGFTITVVLLDYR